MISALAHRLAEALRDSSTASLGDNSETPFDRALRILDAALEREPVVGAGCANGHVFDRDDMPKLCMEGCGLPCYPLISLDRETP